MGTEFYYDPESYWMLRGYTYPYEDHGFMFTDFPGRREVSSILSKLKPSSLLDVGCGAGRLFPLYKEVPRVLAVDFSPSMLMHAYKMRRWLGLENIEIRRFDVRELNRLEESFDLVLSRTVLMHIKPEDIGRTVEGIIKVCKRYVLLIEYFDSPEGLSPHNYSHDYPVLFSRMKLEYSKYIAGDVLFLYRKVI